MVQEGPFLCRYNCIVAVIISVLSPQSYCPATLVSILRLRMVMMKASIHKDAFVSIELDVSSRPIWYVGSFASVSQGLCRVVAKLESVYSVESFTLTI